MIVTKIGNMQKPMAAMCSSCRTEVLYNRRDVGHEWETVEYDGDFPIKKCRDYLICPLCGRRIDLKK